MQIRTRFHSLLLFILIFTAAHNSCAQSDEEQSILLEKLVENAEQSADYTDLVDQMAYGVTHKLYLNQGKVSDFLSLGILSNIQAQSIIKHRIQFGDFISLLELQTLDEISLDTLKLILPYLTIEKSHLNIKSLFKEAKTSKKNMILNFSRSGPLIDGYSNQPKDSNSNYQGSPLFCRVRFSAKNKNIQYGLNGEKDAGEQFLKGSNPRGFDYFTGHVFITNSRLIKKIALGDFQVAFGQGLTLASGLGFGKSAMVLNVKRIEGGLRPYRSFNENEFLRGIGITYGFKNLEFTSFFSRHKVDASIAFINTDKGIQSITKSFILDGYHRTFLEISKEDAVIKTLAGQNVSYRMKNLQIGLTGILNTFNKALQLEDKIFNRYYFSGKQFYKCGLNFDYYFKNVNLFGEITTGNKNSSGYVGGAYVSFGKTIDLVLINRYYSPRFIAFNTNAFSENSNPANEKGSYAGIIMKATKKVSLSGFVDSYKLPWYSYFADATGRGLDYLAELNYRLSKTSLIYARIRTKQELKNTKIGNYNGLNWYERTNMRFHVELKIHPSVVMKLRLEISKYISPENQKYTGSLLYVDLIYRKLNSHFAFNTRLAFFNIGDYNARIYALENDVQYAWSVASYNGYGTKFYLLAKYKYKKNISFQSRYGLINYYNSSVTANNPSGSNQNLIHQINFLISYGFM